MMIIIIIQDESQLGPDLKKAVDKLRLPPLTAGDAEHRIGQYENFKYGPT